MKVVRLKTVTLTVTDPAGSLTVVQKGKFAIVDTIRQGLGSPSYINAFSNEDELYADIYFPKLYLMRNFWKNQSMNNFPNTDLYYENSYKYPIGTFPPSDTVQLLLVCWE